MNHGHFDPVQLPGLAYRHAFDWLAVRLQAHEGAIGCLAPTTFHAAELLRRMPLVPFIEPVPDGLHESPVALGSDPAATVPPEPASLEAIAWLEPDTTSIERLGEIRRALQPDGRLYVIAGGALVRFLVERRLGLLNGKEYLGDRRCAGALKRNDFRISERVGWHGLAAIAWHHMGETAGKMGRSDWRDRYHYAMRRDFGQQGPGRWLVALTSLAAERSA
jgi:hypothetical protein